MTTIEGIANDKVGQAVQAAWVAHDVAQCGYCQSGQVMSAVALLKGNKKPVTRRSTKPWPAISAAVAPITASAPPSMRPRPNSPEDAAMLNPQRIDHLVSGRAGLSRRAFVTTTVGGAVGLALLPGMAGAQAPKGGSKPTEQPLAFVSIAPDGTTTILCNRMDMGQGIETGLAMICAEELDADWRKVRTGFGDQQGQYVDPLFGMHITGGSNSVKNSYQQYRELARAPAPCWSLRRRRPGACPRRR